MNQLEKSSNSLRARTWYSACIAELGLSDSEMMENRGTTSFAELHRRFVIPQLPEWAQEQVLGDGKRLRAFQNVRDRGFDPTASSVRIQTRHAPKGWVGRTRAEQEGQSFVLLPVNLVEATRSSCPEAASWFAQGVWSLWSTTQYHADPLRAYMTSTLASLGLVRSSKVMTRGDSDNFNRNNLRQRPVVRSDGPWWRTPLPVHLDVLAGYVAEATLFGDKIKLNQSASKLRRFLDIAEKRKRPLFAAAEVRVHLELWISECNKHIAQRFGPLAWERFIDPIRAADLEKLVQEGLVSGDEFVD